MNARLIAVDGPLQGGMFRVEAEEFSVGRRASNSLVIADYSISRDHCTIRRQQNRFVISDRGSHNGTLVNGQPVSERVIEHGDQIQVGTSLFLFLTGDSDDVVLPLLTLDETNPLTNSTLLLHPVPAQGRLPEDGRVLRILAEVSSAISTAATVEALCRRLLDAIFDATSAARAAILVTPDESHGDSRLFAGQRNGAPVQFSLSRSLVERVLTEKSGILCTDAGGMERFDSDKTLMTSRPSSIMAAPMAIWETQVGLVYADTRPPARPLGEGDLQLITAVAGMAAGSLERARRLDRLENENRRLRSEIDIQHDMIGESSVMQEVYQFIQKVAPLESTVLVTGESGTGKELVARAIHRNSKRNSKPFVAINCAALTDTLLESELFGYERGAFTGAFGQKRGRIEVAQGGTVFLDEIGEMTPGLQAKMLRVLQMHEFERVGGTQTLHADIRVIAATNRDLKAATASGAFRSDLYYRLNVVSVKAPPLRERREDIALLASFFATKFSEATKRRIRGFSPDARALLNSYDWPGNVRELENAIERAVALGATDVILPEDLPEGLLETENDAARATGFHAAVKDAKKQVILDALKEADGNVAEAARRLRINPTYLHRLMRNLNLRDGQRRAAGQG